VIDPPTVRASTLVIGYGNPSRGDDALGPTAIAEIERRMVLQPGWGQVELLTDFQLQIEFVTDLGGRECIVFIDAAASGAEPFSFQPVTAAQGEPAATHSLSPAGLLAVYRNFHGNQAPPSFLLGVRGYQFELGTPVSVDAQYNLVAALAMLDQWMSQKSGR